MGLLGFLSISELLALRGVELQGTQQCPELCQQGLSAASPKSFKHHFRSHHLSKGCHFTEVFIPSTAVSFEAHPASTASLSQPEPQLGGISSLHFHFCSLFHPSDEDSDSDSD